ncbi:MAG: DNA recombination protein RmuC [Acidobacteria bacterium]|nr:DNA recombination protein RmuC [Acidobacteriota bacterium]
MQIVLEVALALGGGLAAGFAAGWHLARLNAGHSGALAVAQAEARLGQLVSQLTEQKARVEATLAAERAAHDDKVKVYQDAEQRLELAFKGLSSEILNVSSERFLTLAAKKLEDLQGQARTDLDARRQSINELLQPMKESLGQVTATLGQVENSRREDYGRLAAQLTSLDRETSLLVRALRTPIGRGRWGEVQLRRVVEMAGMIERCDFDEQVSVRGDSGVQRPDLVIRLPGGKSIVVDAKAPLAAYLDALEVPDDMEREARLKHHAAQVRAHISQLSSKAYWQQFDPTPEFVVMFLPGEAFFGAALQYDPSLIEFGAERNVIAASPLTLLALLRTVAHGWTQEQLAENAKQISLLGRDLYDRLCKMVDHLIDLRRKLDGAVEAYNATVGAIEGRVLPSARKLRELGVTATKELETLAPVEVATRRLQAPEFIDAAGEPSALDGEVVVTSAGEVERN